MNNTLDFVNAKVNTETVSASAVTRLIAHLGGEIPSTLRPITVDVPRVCRMCGDSGRVLVPDCREVETTWVREYCTCDIGTELREVETVTRSF